MDAGVVTTIIVEAATIIGLLIKQSGERKQNAIEQARRDQAIADELKDIRKDQARMEKKIDEHNGYAKMFSEQSENIASIKKDVEWLKRKQVSYKNTPLITEYFFIGCFRQS